MTVRREVVAYGLAVVAATGAWLWLDTQRFVVVGVCLGALCALLRGQRRVEQARGEFLRLVATSLGARVVANDGGRIVVRNAVAAKLVAWKQVESAGRPIDAAFRVVGGDTCGPIERA